MIHDYGRKKDGKPNGGSPALSTPCASGQRWTPRHTHARETGMKHREESHRRPRRARYNGHRVATEWAESSTRRHYATMGAWVLRVG